MLKLGVFAFFVVDCRACDHQMQERKWRDKNLTLNNDCSTILLESFDGSNPFQIRVPQTMWVVSYCDPGLLHA
jgi:hypothetical protein